MLGMSPAFSPASSQLFPSQNKDNGTGEEDGDRNGPHVALAKHDSSTSYTEDVHFEPLIPLPERVEVQTGEEDEEVMSQIIVILQTLFAHERSS